MSDDDEPDANRVIIIEELDTPAIRREKNLRRKAEKRRLAEAAALHQPQTPSPPKATPAYGGAEMDSELSSLSDSDLTSDGEGALAGEGSGLQNSESTGANFAPSDFPLEGGTLGVFFLAGIQYFDTDSILNISLH
jgi:hypothetical protein